jgi:MoaA/NifB/PqqE/SkfB family radical SAM enzyme
MWSRGIPVPADRDRLVRFHAGELIRCSTPRRLANLALIKVQRRLRLPQALAMPSSYFIDPVNVCNLRCPLCPTGRGVLARPRGRMALPDLRRIVDEIAPYAYRIEMYNWGEPLLHPDIVDMIRYASEKRISVGLSSNLNRFEPGTARELVRSGLSQLVVSIDGASQETYAAYRRQGELDRVLANLRLLLDARREAGTRRPLVIWRMLVGRHNEHEVEEVRQLAHQAGADCFLTDVLYVDTRDPDQIREWLPTDERYRPPGYRQEQPQNRWSCYDLWESMVINWDGGVSPCCWLHDPQFDFGNALTASVRQVWTGPHYASARRVVGRRRGRPDDVPTVCHRCEGHPDYLAR